MAVSKADNIMENMNKSAKHLAEQTLNGAQKRLSDALEKAEKRLKIETDNLKRQRISEINAASGVKISAAENEARAGLFKRREEVRLEVFEEARKRIGEFTQTEKYKDLLIASAKRIREQMEGQCAELIIREADKKYAAEICSYLGNSITLHIDNSIELGGITVKSKNGEMMIDDTLDERLSAEQKWFMENSGLVIE
jgi:V/A-type H+/Na+-transporting ATPase subunit E